MMASTVTRPERDYQGVFSEETEFIVDGGCTDHFVTKLGYFVPGTYVPCGAGDSMTIQTPNGFATAIGHGSVRYRHSSTGQIEVLHAWFAPTFPVNLLSQNKYIYMRVTAVIATMLTLSIYLLLSWSVKIANPATVMSSNSQGALLRLAPFEEITISYI
jgi:hypothetical protein